MGALIEERGGLYHHAVRTRRTGRPRHAADGSNLFLRRPSVTSSLCGAERAFGEDARQRLLVVQQAAAVLGELEVHGHDVGFL